MVGRDKKNIGIVFGGKSNEHKISISSAKTVFKAFNSEINKRRFNVMAFYINKNGEWLNNEQSIKILLDARPKNNSTKSSQNEKLNFLEKIDFQSVDIWFPLLHGLNGEDGAIHGLLKFTQKPLIGCGILGSALGMDKILMKKMFSYHEIPQVKYLPIQNQDLNDENIQKKLLDEIIKKLNFPIFVKPSNSGSSIGISKVSEKSGVIQALKKASEIDSRIVVEEGLDVRELECGIMGYSDLLTSEIGEVIYSTDWYDYDSKYSKNNKINIPADIDSEMTQKVKNIAIQSCKALNVYGFARIDFFLEKSSNKIFLNEINTIPGFTNNSMFPLLWGASGLNIDHLVAKLVDISLVF